MEIVVDGKPRPGGELWQDRHVLVTGASGFLGSHLTGMLVQRGADVVVLVRDEIPPTPIVQSWASRVARLRGDVRDQALLERILGEYEVATVFHLAAQTIVGVANANPVSTLDSNIRGTWALLEAVHRSPVVEQVVVASSDKAYGSQPVLPYTEEMPLLAVHPYDVSKACADMLTMSFHQTYGVPACVTRCGNFFGPGDTNWNRLVPGTMRSLIRGDRPVVRSDGTPIRDYLYVEDGALAYLRLAEAMAADPKIIGQTYNFSTESEITALEFVRLVAEVVGRPDLEPDIRATASNEIPHQFLSAGKARAELGWVPEFTVREALEITSHWYADYLAAENSS